MHCWHDVKPTRITPENFLSLIEISKGSKNKYELDKETGHLILDRVLFTSTIYPQNYGFIPRTFARDYDPLDVLVLCSESILPMSFVRCSPTGKMLGEACADFAAFSSPEAFIFFGGMVKAGELIMKPIREAYDAHVLKIFKNKARFLVSGLDGASAAVLGASAIGWEV